MRDIFPPGLLPGCVVDECQFAKVVTFLERCDGALAVDHHVDRTLEQDVPRATLVALVEYCRIEEKKCGEIVI